MRFLPEGGWCGLQPPAGNIAAAWGARLILTGNYRRQVAQVVPGRAQFFPRTEANPEFVDWCQKTLLPWLHANCHQDYIDPGKWISLEMSQGPYHARANPNASHGYLYVVAWMDEALPPDPPLKPKYTRAKRRPVEVETASNYAVADAMVD